MDIEDLHLATIEKSILDTYLDKYRSCAEPLDFIVGFNSGDRFLIGPPEQNEDVNGSTRQLGGTTVFTGTLGYPGNSTLIRIIDDGTLIWKFLIGRRTSHHLVVPYGNFISKDHAVIFKDGDVIKIRDSSQNGTYVEGERLKKGVGYILDPNRRILFGPNLSDAMANKLEGVVIQPYLFHSPETLLGYMAFFNRSRR